MIKCTLTAFAAAVFSLAASAADLPVVDDGLTLSTWIAEGNDVTASECDWCQRLRAGVFTTQIGSQTITVTYPNNVPLTNVFQTSFGSRRVFVSYPNHSLGPVVSIIPPTARLFTISGAPIVGGLDMNGTWQFINITEQNRFAFDHTNPASSAAGPTGSANITTHHNWSVGDKLINYIPSQTVGGLDMGGFYYSVATIPNLWTYTFTHPQVGGALSTVSTPTGTMEVQKSYAANELKMRFVCEAAHLAYDDPIVFPGQPGMSHLHQFFGNDQTHANSTYASLRSTGHGSCAGGDLNRTGYWQPAMINFTTNKVVKPIHWVLYYQTTHRKQLWTDGLSGTPGFTSSRCVSQGGSGTAADGTVIACPMQPTGPFERGLKMVWGFKAGAGKFPNTYKKGNNPTELANSTGQNFDWSCTTTAGVPVSGNGDNFEVLTGCPSPGQLTVRMDTPRCWTGDHDTNASYPPDTPVSGNDHYSHLAYEHNDGISTDVCPATHPKRIPQITVISTWGYADWEIVRTQWALSSDRFQGATYPRGGSYHTDWFGAWNTPVQTQWQGHIMGMYPVAGTWPYIYNTVSGASPAWNVVGGPYGRTTIDGGMGFCGTLGGSSLGFSDFCFLRQGTLPNGYVISGSHAISQEVDVPSPMQVRLRYTK